MSSELKPTNVKAKILEKAQTFNSFKGKVKNLSKKLSILGAFQEGSQKDEFIQKYGIQMEMPAIYIYESFFYRPDNKYVINAFCQVFPESITYLDFSKIDKNEDPRGDMFVDQQLDFSNLLCFKVYQMDNNKYQQVSLRKCDSSYQHKITFSADKTKVAIFRLEKNSTQAHSDPKAGLLSTLVHSNGNQQKENIFEAHQHYVIDIFDCSSIDFFTRDTVLTPKDPSHIHTIRSKDFQSIHKFEQSFLRFSINNRYFYISQERKTLFFYDLTEAKNDIDQPTEQLTIPSLYECVINISIDEDDIRESLIGVKKTDFRNIEVVPLKMLQEMRDLLNTSQVRSSFIGVTDLQKIARNYPVSSIRIDHFNLERTSMRFSEDKTQVIYCDDSQHILLELAQEGMKQHQKSVHHLKQKTTRFIQRYGDSEFLIATADAQDKCISIRHSSDSNKKIKFYFRFKEGSTQVRDIYHFEDRVRIMVTRDDEEFIIYEYRNFETKEVFWQRFLESSNYIFEWPYLCYLKGQHHIIIQNAFNPGVVFYLELHEICKQGMISNMFVSDQYLLYVVISTDTEYLIYEKDLDKCMPYLFQQDFDLKHSQIDHPASQDSLSPPNSKHQEKLKYKVQPSINNAARPYMSSMLTSKMQKTKPIARVSKEYLGYKGIYKLFVRSPSTKEIIQTNQERIIFFLCNFKIYSITSGKVEIVDTGYKF